MFHLYDMYVFTAVQNFVGYNILKEMLLSIVLYLLCSLDHELQVTYAAIIANLATKLIDR